MVGRLNQVCVGAMALVFLCSLAAGYRATTVLALTGESRLANYVLQSPGDTILLSDDFKQNAIDPGKWTANNLFSGFSDAAVAVTAGGQELNICPLKQGEGGAHHKERRVG